MNSSSKSLSPLITAPRMTAFSPGQSPPEVRIPIFMGGAHFRREPVGAGIGAGIGGAADVAGPPGSSDAGCRVLAGVGRVLVLVDRCGNGAPLWRPGIGLGADLAPALGGALQGGRRSAERRGGGERPQRRR